MVLGLRGQRLLNAGIVILAGLVIRAYGYEIGLPFILVKYGGSVLWGAMVYFLMGMVTGDVPIRRIVFISLVIAVAVEFFRLYHLPWLDTFRLTLWGKLLLGRVFALWNILAYAIGIALAALWEGLDR
ncbi:DUF2809 domain-containing protein [Rhizobium oryzicola]|uniref:DUF2809 domain-containing protein n=1 Tax=Rhizobium oryzicola TaxID=1232668 RepID=A0ABT8T307_9HYPH|nr:DUF2809 domain-containing protein [Rhizobium oryzicola]MDO1585013.1 DUF2809 domain-containing protein [Rhizobium oryzicola]